MTENTLAVQSSAEDEIKVLSRWDAIAADIAMATEESCEKIFDYTDKEGNKQARSWVASLRKLNSKIEKARKNAKSIHLERGRKVDETAKVLKKAVESLIDPHQKELEAIERKEQERIAAHRLALDLISSLCDGITTSEQAKQRLAKLEEVDIESLEEFSIAGENRKAEAYERLNSLCKSFQEKEAEQAEMEALLARQQVELEILRAEKARTEAKYTEAKYAEKGNEVEPLKRSSPLIATPLPNSAQSDGTYLESEVKCKSFAQETFTRELVKTMSALTVEQIASAIVSNTLHPAIAVDWSKTSIVEVEVNW